MVTVRLNPAPLTLRGSYQEVYAAFGPPRAGKSNWLAQVALDAPGACLFTSTRADLAVHTAKARSGTGPVRFLNPGLDGGFPSNLHWSPLAGCGDPRMAMEAAGALIHAAPHDTSGKDAYWDHQSKVALQCFLHAAALTPGADITIVRRWASDPIWAGKALEALRRHGAPGWADTLYGLIERSTSDERYWSAISSGAVTALAWLDDPALADLACPLPGGEFDARQFIRDRGTVYVIGGDTPHNPQSPYFACFATCLWSTAKRMAADPAEPASHGLKLDPAFTPVIDEPAITCPVPLDRWATESAGHGIVLVTGFQSDAQLRQMFGEHAGQVLEDVITVKLVFGGVTGAIAEKASKWGGDQDTWHGTKANLRQERAFPPERICGLPVGSVFIKHRSTRAFIARLGRVEDHPRYEPAFPADFPADVRAPVPQPAIEAPRRAPIAPPYTPPAIADAAITEEESWLESPATSCAG